MTDISKRKKEEKKNTLLPLFSSENFFRWKTEKREDDEPIKRTEEKKNLITPQNRVEKSW